MKKTVFVALVLLLLPPVSHADVSLLKLRASHHPEFLRIVLEGNESVIDKKLVYQRGEDILISFPETDFSIQSEQQIVAFEKINTDTVMFSPGAFRGLKVFILKNPTRLVLDVHMKGAQRREPYERPKKREAAKGLNRIETLVIDPGHGGFETGIVKERENEKNTVLDIAKKLQALANTGSSKGYLTRGSDHYMAMSERVKFTNSKAANVFLSIHVGHHSDIVIYTPVITEQVSGIIKPYLYNRGQADYAKDTATLLRAVKEALISHFGQDMVSVRPMPYSMLSRIEAAALMIEFPSFEDAYYIEEFNSEIATALYKGLYIYEEIKEK